MTITRINRFKAAPGKAEELFEFLKSLVPHIEFSKGCEGCQVLREQDCSDSFVVLERWDSVADHQESVAAFPKEDMARAIPLFGEAPEGAYFTDC